MASALDILVSPAKVDEPIEMLPGGGEQTRVGTRDHMGVLVGATWRIRLIISDAAAMWHAITITVATF